MNYDLFDAYKTDIEGLSLTNIVVSPPVTNTMKVTVPYREGEVDLTEWLGNVHFGNRWLELTYKIDKDAPVFETYERAVKLLNNQRRKIKLYEENIGLSINLINLPYSDRSGKTHNGITYTISDDIIGTLTPDGTATNESQFLISEGIISPGKYLLGGGINTESQSGEYLKLIITSDDETLSDITIMQSTETPVSVTIPDGYEQYSLYYIAESGTVVSHSNGVAPYLVPYTGEIDPYDPNWGKTDMSFYRWYNAIQNPSSADYSIVKSILAEDGAEVLYLERWITCVVIFQNSGYNWEFCKSEEEENLINYRTINNIDPASVSGPQVVVFRKAYDTPDIYGWNYIQTAPYALNYQRVQTIGALKFKYNDLAPSDPVENTYAGNHLVYDGRLSVGELHHDGNFWSFVVTADCKPYKTIKNDTMELL